MMWPFKKKTSKPWEYDWDEKVELSNGIVLVGDAARKYNAAIAAGQLFPWPLPFLRFRRGGQCVPAPGRPGITPPPLRPARLTPTTITGSMSRWLRACSHRKKDF